MRLLSIMPELCRNIMHGISRDPNAIDHNGFIGIDVLKVITLSHSRHCICGAWILIGKTQPRKDEGTLHLHVMVGAACCPSDAADPAATTTSAAHAHVTSYVCGHRCPLQAIGSHDGIIEPYRCGLRPRVGKQPLVPALSEAIGRHFPI